MIKDPWHQQSCKKYTTQGASIISIQPETSILQNRFKSYQFNAFPPMKEKVIVPEATKTVDINSHQHLNFEGMGYENQQDDGVVKQFEK